MTVSEEDKKTEQTAVADNTNEGPKEAPAAESGAAQEEGDGLDELLKEFDERRSTSQEQNENVAKSEPKAPADQIDVAALAALEKRLNEQEVREHERELKSLYSNLADGTQADEIDVEIFLGRIAKENPKLNQVYLNRVNDPGSWKRAEKAIRQEVVKRFGKKVDKQVTESREAVASAVRSASTAAPHKDLTRDDIVNMSKDDFDEVQRKLGIVPV